MPAKLFPNFTRTHLIIHAHVSKLVLCYNLWVHSLGWMTRIRIINIRSLALWCYKGTNKLLPRMDLSVPLIHHDASDLGSLILMRIQIYHPKGTHFLGMRNYVSYLFSVLTGSLDCLWNLWLTRVITLISAIFKPNQLLAHYTTQPDNLKPSY